MVGNKQPIWVKCIEGEDVCLYRGRHSALTLTLAAIYNAILLRLRGSMTSRRPIGKREASHHPAAVAVGFDLML